MADESEVRIKCEEENCPHEYHGLGLILDPSKAPSPEAIKSAQEEVHPDAAPPEDIDLTDLDTPIKDQGSIGSCTAFGGVAVLEHEMKRLGLPLNDLSELYLYYRNRQVAGLDTNQDTGAYGDSPAKAASQYGCCLEALDPYNVSNFRTKPTAAMDQNAANFKIVGSQNIGGNNLDGIWNALRNRQGPYICFYVYNTFMNVGSNGIVPAPGTNERPIGGHCIKISGWSNNRSAPGGLGYFKCKNSWGTYHGDQGYYWVPTLYFTAGVVSDVYSMTLPEGDTPPDPEPSEGWKSEVTGIAEEVQRIVTSAQETGWTSANVRSELGSIKDYMNQTIGLVPDDFPRKQEVVDIAQEVQRIVTSAQNTGWSSASVRSSLGAVKDYMDQIKGIVGEETPPDPEPGNDEDWGNLLSGAQGVTSPRKWYPANGMDVFVPRNTILNSPFDGTMSYIQVQAVPGYLSGEMIISMDDGRTVRFRHVQSIAGSSGRVSKGQPVAKIYDPTMDIIYWPPSWPYRAPDGYQHADISLATSRGGLDPTGGSGGNVNSYKHIFEEEEGIDNITVHPEMRTPGPGDSGR